MATPSKSAPIMSSDYFKQNGKVTEPNANMLQSSLSPQNLCSLDGPVAILWDIENCPVPSDVLPEDVAGNIRMALRVHPVIQGAVMMFSAYGDFNSFPRRLREGCQRTGVKLVDVPNGRKDAADKAILVDMFLFALDHPPPSSIMLISGDVDFSPALHILGQRGYTVILVIPAGVGVSSALCNAGKFVWDWPSVSRGEGFFPPSKGLVPPRGGQIENAKFMGEADPEKAIHWVQEIEKNFEILQTPEAAKVGVASDMLFGDAGYWWRETRQIMEANHVEITWISFRNAFLDKFFPVSAREEKEVQFMRLYQGNMTVGEYAAKMESLSKHFRYFQVQMDEAFLCNRFMSGLCKDIKESVRPLAIGQFQQLVDKCCEIEMMKNQRGSGQGSGGPIRSSHQSQGKSGEGKHYQKKPYLCPQGRSQASGPDQSIGGTSRSHGTQPQKKEVVCFKCNNSGHYANACFKYDDGLCWNCNKPGHMSKDCRVPKAESVKAATGKRSMGQGRVYTMSGEEAANVEELIQGGTSKSCGTQPQKKEVVCSKCNKSGHYASACEGRIGYVDPLCWNCKMPGHILRDCRAQKAEPAMNAQGRFYTMSGEEAAYVKELIQDDRREDAYARWAT